MLLVLTLFLFTPSPFTPSASPPSSHTHTKKKKGGQFVDDFDIDDGILHQALVKLPPGADKELAKRKDITIEEGRKLLRTWLEN
ncbi:MAG: hypothetical protein J3Q66DRAFT_345334 [Benniella sp.]|nr:MAG: hypothetical protein J3Q66DRAFT_345334 [Benniella sp.]